MFFNASSFNQDISDWNVSKVTNMGYMFGRSTGTPPMAFNNKGQPLNSWSVYNVINLRPLISVDLNSGAQFMSNMFFNQNISSWNVSAEECFKEQ